MKINDFITEAEKVRLDPKCWTGKKIGNPKTKVKGGVRVNNCVPAESVAEGFEFEDAYGQGYSDGYDGKGYNSPFPIGSNEDDEYEDGYSSGRLDYNKMNRDLDEQGVAEDYNAEYDDEAGMADNNLETLARAVEGIDDVISAGDNLPEWCQEKIAVAKSMLVAVWDYMKSEENIEQGVSEGSSDSVSFREMINVVDEHYPKYYAELSGSDISDEQFKQEIISTYNEITNKQGVAEGICSIQEANEIFDDFERSVEARGLTEDIFDSITDEQIIAETAAWRRKEGKSAKGGLNAKGVASYRRENPGSKLQTAVTTKPSKLKPGSKAAKRRKSFCARMGGVKGPMKKPNGKPTRKALALRKWNC